MKWSDWKVKAGILLIFLAIIFYTADYLIFKDAKSVLFYIGIDLAFIPVEILILVLVVESAINKKEKQIIMEKLNMVIGAFFSEVGTDLLRHFSVFDDNKNNIKENLLVKMDWTENDFLNSAETIKSYEYGINLKSDLGSDVLLYDLKTFLKDKREFMLRLLENPNLLEHDRFTDLLWAVFHLTEELDSRGKLEDLPDADYQHLALDIQRAYSLLIYEWLEYMEHLMENYPYLFSLALRTNPFDPEAKVEIN
ncbi:hypothetical protein [Methanobacterium alcaliphilum]|uniref:hypothetical protein n=1 Tax=Methanobacterium alcaliphilum TaxID=392018 RepID=UPI002009FA5C|nr:hypothetical protein [Methanobacterium alcaliphilum]MCK9151660.1 hypothetical protein [Methanobacterium alcaliphilum]